MTAKAPHSLDQDPETRLHFTQPRPKALSPFSTSSLYPFPRVLHYHAVFRNEDFHPGVTLVPEHAEKVYSRLGKLSGIKIVLLARAGGPPDSGRRAGSSAGRAGCRKVLGGNAICISVHLMVILAGYNAYTS